MTTSLSSITTLFSSLSSSSTYTSINYADYAAIRNGSYGKLLKAYYSQLDSSTSTSTSSSSTTSTTSTSTDTTGLSKVKTAADSLKTAATALDDDDLWTQTNGEYDWDSITSAVQSFVDSYNNVITQSSGTTSSSVSSAVSTMTSLSTTLQNALSKVGITVGSDQKLTLDTETLQSANISSLKTLFTGSYSYVEQIASKAGSISSAALSSGSLYSSSGLLTSSLSSLFDTSL